MSKINTKKDLYFKKLFPEFNFRDVENGSYKSKIEKARASFRQHVAGWNLYDSRDDADKSLVKATVLSNFQTKTNSNELPLCSESKNTVILYAGGGGFLANLQILQEGFLINWAKDTNITIFEAHYSLCPEHKYPYQTNELFNMYMQIVMHYKVIQGVSNLRMIIMGDSAGGNIIASLMNMLAAVDAELPCELHLVYPAVDLRVKRFTPSMLHSLDDQLLYFTIAKECFKSYVPNNSNAEIDWLLSPCVAPDWILKKYPKTYFYSGDKDCLRDDCLRMAHRINQLSDQDSRLVQIAGLYHGFLGFKLPMGFGISEAGKIHQLIQNYLTLGFSQ